MTPFQPTRRQHLRQLAAGMVTAGIVADRHAFANEASNPKLKIAAIGVGNRGFDNLLAVKSEEIVAICDVDEQFIGPVKESIPEADVYRDWRKLLERDDLDAVIISTPDHTHAPIALAAIARGLHVYCEKPLAHSIDETRRIAAAAHNSPVVTQMGNQHHASDGYRRAVEWLRSGRLGSIQEIHVWTNRPIWPQGIGRPLDEPPIPDGLDWDLWLGPAPARPYHPAYHPLRWRGWWDFGNGAIGDMGPHLIDPVFWGLELSAPGTIHAESSPVNDETAPEWSIVRFWFPATANRTAFPLVWYDGGKLPPPDITGVNQPPANGTLVIAERAKLFIPELGRRPIVVPHDRSDRIETPEPTLPRPESHHAEWIAACKETGQTSCGFEYGAKLSELCLLGAIATRVGQRLQWDIEKMSFHNSAAANALLQREYRTGW